MTVEGRRFIAKKSFQITQKKINIQINRNRNKK